MNDDDARNVRVHELLAAAGWRPRLVEGRRHQLRGTGKAAATNKATVAEVYVEVQARASPIEGGSEGGEDSNSGGGSGGAGGSASVNACVSTRWSMEFRGSSGDAVDPVTRRLLTACNTDWRMQLPNAVGVCKAPTADQVP